MKRNKILLFILMLCGCGLCVCLPLRAQPDGVEIKTGSCPELILKDTAFFYNLDYLMYNSICPTIGKMDHKYMFISSNGKDSDGNYSLCVDFYEDLYLGENYMKWLQGCFDYKGLVVFCGKDIPDGIVELSGTVRELTYYQDNRKVRVYDPDDPENTQTSFWFDYKDGCLELDTICCRCKPS